MKTILSLLLLNSVLLGQRQAGDMYPWTETYQDCMQTNVPVWGTPSYVEVSTIAARCVGPNPAPGTDLYYNVGEYMPWVLLGSGYGPYIWTSPPFLFGWDVCFPDLNYPFTLVPATNFGVRPIGAELIDDWRFVAPPWMPGLAGTSWTVQFVGLRSGENVFSSGLTFNY
jgi:hypothetical protein